MAAREAYPHLLSPITVGPRRIKNRVASTTHGTAFGWSDPRDDGERQIAYVARRAAGGVGLYGNQGAQVVPVRSRNERPYAYLGERVRRLADAAHRHEMIITSQVIHLGAQFRSDADPALAPIWSFSGRTTPDGEATHAMSADEVEWVIDGYVELARELVAGGLDGVELHGAHGYLIQQSISPWGNQRTDKWGEPLALVRELIGRTRAAIGRDAMLGLRISIDDFLSSAEGGAGQAHLMGAAGTLAREGGLDYITQSEGARVDHYARSIGSWRHPHGEFLPLTAKLKAAVGKIPVIGVGRIVTPEQAEAALAQGACDLTAMTRPHIADPDIVAKIQRGEAHRIRRCVGANQGCVDRILRDLPITCIHNPEVGREHVLGELAHGESAKRVLVVGGGPAGLKTAEIAARRGCRVTLVERGPQLGGRLLTATLLPAARELLHMTEWLEAEIRELGVEIRTGVEADAAFVRGVAPDVVVLATGAKPEPSLALGQASDGSVEVWSTDQAMIDPPTDKHVLVLDRLGTHDAVRAAERLALAGCKVTVVAPRPVIGAFIGVTHSVETPPRLLQLGCELTPMCDAVAIEGGKVRLRNLLSGAEQAATFDLVVASGVARPDLALADALAAAGLAFELAGDVQAPRTALHAIRSGNDLGRRI